MRPHLPLQNFVLRCVRMTRGWRIEELAALVGVSFSAMREIETGRIFLTQERLTRYVVAMGVPFDGLTKIQEILASLRSALRR